MELEQVVMSLRKAIVKDKLVSAAFAPRELGIGRGKGTIIAQLPDGSFCKIKVSILSIEADSEES